NGVVAKTPHSISCRGLGSCVALILYDTRLKIGGIAHIMLPGSNGSSLNRPCTHADIAIVFLLEQLDKKGATRGNIVAKIVGGASMFANGGDSGPTIGEQNIISIRHILNQERIPLIGKDVGGNYGRSIQLYLDSGKVIVYSIGRGSKEI
ncbi:MAG: chemotaxis protein CheD, partial [Dehalococcoidia bacterium]|nr:chemotaxis protein CheD [Dehalococcoidia bacterium]